MSKEGPFEKIITNMQNSTKPKPAPVRANKPTYFFDTAQGVDHLTKTLHDLTDIKPEDAVKMNKETKLALIKSEGSVIIAKLSVVIIFFIKAFSLLSNRISLFVIIPITRRFSSITGNPEILKFSCSFLASFKV